MKALLIRDIPVRVLDISDSGFLFESDWPFMEGAIGELRLQSGEAERHDVARVGRTVFRQGARSPYVVGGEFLPSGGRTIDAIGQVLAAVRPQVSVHPSRPKRWRRNA